MDKLKHPFEIFFGIVPKDSIPIAGTKAYVLLSMLIDGELHNRDLLAQDSDLGESFRVALQDLRGDRFNNWLIHSVKLNGASKSQIQLDPRHLLGDSIQDAAARRERKKEYKQDSRKKAEEGGARTGRAIVEASEAQRAYFLGLGEAVNDE